MKRYTHVNGCRSHVQTIRNDQRGKMVVMSYMSKNPAEITIIRLGECKCSFIVPISKSARTVMPMANALHAHAKAEQSMHGHITENYKNTFAYGEQWQLFLNILWEASHYNGKAPPPDWPVTLLAYKSMVLAQLVCAQARTLLTRAM